MNEPDSAATDENLANYYTADTAVDWGYEQTVQRAERLDVTIPVRFTPAEIAAVRARAAAAGLKRTAYIRRCALVDEQPPVDRAKLNQSIATLSRDIEDLRRAVR